LLANALKSTNECVSITDLNDRVLFINQSFINTYGFDEKDLKDSSISMIRSPNTPAEISREILPATLRGGWHGEVLNRKKDGSEFLVSLSTAVVKNSQGQPFALIGVATDITEKKKTEEALKQSEERFRSVTRTANDAIISVDSKGKILGWNNGAGKIFGYEEREIIGQALDLIIPEKYKEPHKAGMSRLEHGGNKHVIGDTVELHGQNKNGHVFPIELSLSDWETSEGKFYTGIIRDISQRKQVEEEIKQKNEQLQLINAEKDKFFSIIAHDLRGPMSSFVAATQILTEAIQSMTLEEIREITIEMKTSASNIYSLLENLLEWSRLKRGVMEFDPVKFNLRKMTDSSIGVVLESAKKKEIEIEISIPGNIEVMADTHMVETVIRNLVSNSVKFTPVGGKINVSAVVKQDNSVEVKVTDTGIGMTPLLISKLFLINEKTSRQGTKGELSSGLGLLLCKEFIEKHGGKIWVESEVGKGSTFFFTIGQAS
jgi:PAS domain S-box-containing protein